MVVDPCWLLAAAEIREPLLPLWAMELMASAFLYAWLFCMGATVGSFLNVVVYRLPRQKNLAYPGSFCPRCGHPIRLTDNIPIVSWLVLRGRCRDCGGAISARYFVVELLVAAAFLIVLAGEHFLPASILPYASRPPLTPRDGVPFWCMYATHLALVTTLVGAILIRADGFRVPARLFLPVLVLGFVLPLLWPEIRSLPALSLQESRGWRAGLTDGLTGICAGLAMAVVGSWLQLRSSGRWPTFAPLALGASVGVVLGWQRTIVWLPVILLLYLLVSGWLQRLNIRWVVQTEPSSQSTPNEASSPPPHHEVDLP